MGEVIEAGAVFARNRICLVFVTFERSVDEGVSYPLIFCANYGIGYLSLVEEFRAVGLLVEERDIPIVCQRIPALA